MFVDALVLFGRLGSEMLPQTLVFYSQTVER